LVAIYTFVATRNAPQSRRIWFGKILVVTGMVGSLLIAFYLLTPQAYRDTGRAMPATFWHHVIIGFGTNPAWPFGNLADQYRNCYPERPGFTLVPGMTDDTGGCVWAAYATRHGISWGPGLYTREFDVGIREAVLKIFWQYPYDSLVTFVYYKPLRILHTLGQYFEFSVPARWSFDHEQASAVPGLSVRVAVLIICEFAIFIGFVAFNRGCLSVRTLRPVYFGLILAAVSTCSLYIAAYSSPITSVDLFFYILALIGALIANLIAAIAQSIWPSGQQMPAASQ
jgi:hypothetical protein